MAGFLNKVMIIGNLGRDPEMRYLPDGTPNTSFSVAVNRVWNTPEGERRDETEWFNVVAWRKLAETCNQFLSKGRKVYIEGRLRTRSWEGQDGQKHYRTEVIAERMQLMDSRPPAAEAGAEAGAEAAPRGGQVREFPRRQPAAPGRPATSAEPPPDGDAEPDDLPF